MKMHLHPHNTNKLRRRDVVEQEVRHSRLHRVHAAAGQQEGQEQDGRLHGLRQGLRPERRRVQ